MYTDEEIGRLMASERERIRGQFADYEELKTQRAELTETLADTNATLAEKETAISEFAAKEAGWETERATAALRQVIVEAATAAGFRVPTDAYALIDRELATAKPEDVKELVAALADSRADLLGELGPSVPGTGATQPRRSGQPDGETREQKLTRLGLATGGNQIFEGGGVILPPGMEG